MAWWMLVISSMPEDWVKVLPWMVKLFVSSTWVFESISNDLI